MPNVLPRFYSTYPLPGASGLVPISPQMMGMEAGFGIEAGKRLEALGEQGFKIAQKLQEAADAEKILNLHYDLKDEFTRTAEKFKDNRDYDNFESLGNAEKERIKSQYESKITNNNVGQGFNKSFRKFSSDFDSTLLHRKAK